MRSPRESSDEEGRRVMDLVAPVRRRPPYYVVCVGCGEEVTGEGKMDVRTRAWQRRWEFCRVRLEWFCPTCGKACRLCRNGCSIPWP